MMKKIYVIHSTGFDFENELYVPLRKSSEFDFVFPHAIENELIDSKNIIKNCDVVLAEVSFPSTGSGIELGRSEMLGVPIVAIHKKGTYVSSSINFLTKDIIEYESIEKDFDKLGEILNLRAK